MHLSEKGPSLISIPHSSVTSFEEITIAIQEDGGTAHGYRISTSQFQSVSLGWVKSKGINSTSNFCP